MKYIHDGTSWMEDFLQDGRYAVRMIRRQVVFSALIVFVLAIGIGADTAVFRVVHEVLLKPLPFRDPSRLLAVWDTYLPAFSKVGLSPAELESWRAQGDLFDETAWYRYVPLDGDLAVAGAAPVAVHADFVSTNLFPLLGVRPLLGRGFGPAEDPHSALVSDRLWRRSFGGDVHVIGRTVRFNGEPLTVVGVMAPEAQFPEWADLWLAKGPLVGDELTNPVRHALGFLARRRAGIDETRASERLREISLRLAREHPKTSTGWGIRVSGLQDDLTGDVRPALELLVGAASLLLLIACANVASLLLARNSGRGKEMAIRTAVGASSIRIVRQLVTESLVLAVPGGVCGWLIAKAGLLAVLPERARLGPETMVFLAATSLAAGVLFGLAQAAPTLRAGRRAAMRSSGVRVRSALVVIELALTLMLVIGAGILARSFVRTMQVNPGFRPEGVLTVRVLVPPSWNPEALFHRIEEKLRALPGVRTIAVTNALPLIGDRANTSRFNIPGSPLVNPEALPAAQIRAVSPEYFQAMKIAMLAGRTFSERDLNQPVVIINETMAKRFWPGRNAVGIRFVTGPWSANPAWSTIAGVVADVKDFGLDAEPGLDIYHPSLAGQYLVVKTAGDPMAIRGNVERALHAIDPELAVSEIRSMNQIASESARKRRWTMGLLAAFAGLAFVLAVAGIYGVASWAMEQRRREVGIRMALGAQRHQILTLVLGYGARLAVAGLTLGIAGSLALRRALSGLVYGVSTSDPVTYLCVPGVMLAAVLAACYVPARRASRADPLVSLRYE